jgi:ferredoxin-NADP reductase
MEAERAANLARRPLNRVLRSRLVAGLTSPRSIDDYLGLLDPAWSVEEVRARVVALRPEGDQATSVLLRTNENWRGFRAGQFVQLSVLVGGVRHTRSFSISSAPEDGQPLRVTIKRVPGGRVSGWAQAHARVGEVVGLSQALGAFTLPDPVPRRLLFVTGGSGITPALSMVRHLAAVGYDGEIAWMHYARRESLFEDELAQLARGRRKLRLAVGLTRPRSPLEACERFSVDRLRAFEPKWEDCEAFACGPEALNRDAIALWEARSLGARLHVEQFVPAPVAVLRPGGAGGRLRFARSHKEHQVTRAASLLEHAEAAGLRPPHGCRMGICHTCTCKKVSGTVRNELTGESSSGDNEEIRLCVSTPLSDVTLDI